MSKSTLSIHSFARGEISPRLYGRQDLQHYYLGLKDSKNAIITSKGEWERRCGTVLIDEIEDSEHIRLIPFEPRQGQSYMLVMSNAKLRFLQNHSWVRNDDGSIYELSTPFFDDDIDELSYVQSIDVLFIAHGKHHPKILQHYANNNWQLKDFNLIEPPYLPINSDDNKKMCLQGKSYSSSTVISAPYGVLKTGDTIVVSILGRNYHKVVGKELSNYEVEDTSADTLNQKFSITGLPTYEGSLSSIFINGVRTSSDGITIQSSNDEDLNYGVIEANFDAFSANDMGRSIRLRREYEKNDVRYVQWQSFVVTEILSARKVRTNAPSNHENFAWTYDWRKSYFWHGNYPHLVALHESRLTFAKTKANPQGIWLSKVADYQNFAPSLSNGETPANVGISLQLDQQKLNEIFWLQSSGALEVGTASNIWVVRPSDYSEGLTTHNAVARPIKKTACADTKCLAITDVTLFAHRSNKQLRGLYAEGSGYISAELSELSDHILQSEILYLCWQETPHSIVWILMQDGSMVAATINMLSQMRSFHKHDFGGTIKAIETMSFDKSDFLYMIIKRGNKHYLEYMIPSFNDGQASNYCEYLDHSQYFNRPGSEVTSKFFVENETYRVVADGKDLRDFKVLNAKIILPSANYSHVSIGKSYSSYGQTLNLAGGVPSSASVGIGSKRRADTAIFQVYKSAAFEWSGAEDLNHVNWMEISSQDSAYSGLRKVKFFEGYESVGLYVAWRQNAPKALVISAIHLIQDYAGM